MAREENLISLADRTTEEQREIAIKGGKKSGEIRRARKTLREELLLLLQQNNNQNNITVSLIQRAMTGDTKAFEVIRDTIGEKPKDVVENINFNQEEIEKYKKLSLEELKKLADKE